MAEKGKAKRKRIFSIKNKIFLSIFGLAVVFCIFAAIDQYFMLSNLVTYSGIFVIIAASFVIAQIVSSHITRPIKKVRSTLEELKLGHIHERCSIRTNDEIGLIAADLDAFAANFDEVVIGSFKRLADGDVSFQTGDYDESDIVATVLQNSVETMRLFSQNTRNLINAASSGRLDERINANKFKGTWRDISNDVNSLMDNIEKPVTEIKRILERILINDFSDKVTGSYIGIFDELSDDMDQLCKNLIVFQNVFILISKGDTSYLSKLEARGKLSENDNMSPSVIMMMRAIDNLINEVNYLSDESTNGNVIKVRGDEDKFEGGFKEIVKGFNNTLDGISKPIVHITEALNDMADNDLSHEIRDDFNGDYKVMLDAVKKLHDNLLLIQKAAILISQGDTSIVNEMKEAGKKSENDQLTPALIQMTETMQLLVDETTSIVQAAAGGELNVRGNAGKFEGQYAAVIASVNDLMDAIEAPVNEVTDIMTKMSTSGNLQLRMTGNYKGQFQVLSDSVNRTIDNTKKIIGYLSHAITEMSSGNFGVKKMHEIPGDYRILSESINTILDSMNDLLSNIVATSDQVAAGSAQVSQGSQSLSQGSTEQASTVEELTASLNDISARTKQNASDANEANRLVISVKENASSGSNNMNNLLQSMSDINESSQNISKIIKLIDDIAFQTNILALNAAVEAARAGQYGKGFAVVAQEVRNLAVKSAAAAKNTADLIEETSDKIKKGTEIANQTAEALGGIVDGIDSVTTVMNKISAATNEQATGISQIDVGLDQVSKVVQTNSATSEESAAASEELSSQADLLKSQVNRFKLRAL